MAKRVVAAAVTVAVVAGLLVGLLSRGASSGSPSVAPDFHLPALGAGGSPISLSSLRGRPVVLNFFASWCAPCREELPLLARSEHDLSGEVTFVGVDVSDQDASALALVRASGVTYPIAVDRSYQVSANDYHLYGLPDTVFVDATGQQAGMVSGPLTQASLSRWLGRIGVHPPPVGAAA